MVQVDVFWSYGLGSGLALAAGKKLKQTTKQNFWHTQPFVLTLLWISLFFAPSGIYLLWNFPWWETMFLARTHTDIPAWLVVIFSVTNITQGILGYYVTARLIALGKSGAAKLQTIWSHGAMLFILIVGWDGTGFKRFLYAGDGDDWFSNRPFSPLDFFSSPVFYTLISMGIILVPSYFYLVQKLRK